MLFREHSFVYPQTIFWEDGGSIILNPMVRKQILVAHILQEGAGFNLSHSRGNVLPDELYVPCLSVNDISPHSVHLDSFMTNISN